MRIFEITGNEDIELRDQNDRIVGIYLPGMRYTCRDDLAQLSNVLDQWVVEGKAKVVEESAGTGPSSVGGE